ncbi:hypothetical protein ACF05L_32850 [Streptomyces bobili]|uniref:hypothetical protein n=1 Tax=Streptomyces bobili TaxID=67280 RepID=UPI0036FF6237
MTATLAALIALTCTTTWDDNPSGTSQQVGGHTRISDNASRSRPRPHTAPGVTIGRTARVAWAGRDAGVAVYHHRPTRTRR